MDINKPKIINKDLSAEEISYIAGVVDSSCSFCIGKQKISDKKYSKRGYLWRCRLILCNGDERIVLFIRNLLFNPLIEKASQRHKSPGKTIIYRIILEGPVLDFLLPLIRNKSVTRKEHIDICIKFRNSISSKEEYRNGTPDDVEELRALLCNELKKLNTSLKSNKL